MNTKINNPKLHLSGLTEEEVAASRLKHGVNELTPPSRDPWWKQYLEKYNDPVIRILLIAAFIALLVGLTDGHYFEALGILIAVLLATTLAFLNEYAANRKFDILNQVSDEVPVKVIRDGSYHSIPRKEVVVDDLVMVETGEEIPADGFLVEAVSLQIDESRLTGESLPVTKRHTEHQDKSAHSTAYAEDFLLRETFVRDGHAIFRVSAVGDHTEIGKTARAAGEASDVKTPLNKQLEKLSKIIGLFGFTIALSVYIALVVRGAVTAELVMSLQQWSVMSLLSVSVFIAILPVWLPMGYDFFELIGHPRKKPDWLTSSTIKSWLISFSFGLILIGSGIGIGVLTDWLPPQIQNWLPGGVGTEFLNYFMIAVTIIVVAVPEGLAMSVTLSLAYSMRKMTESNNLVRRMHACETIGATTVICTDKTGTLTQNVMNVQMAHFDILPEDPKPDMVSMGEKLVVESIAANSTAQLEYAAEMPKVIGNPTEGALLLWLNKCGLDYLDNRNLFKVDQQWTFNTERKFMATLGTSETINQSILYLKGAPEIILDRCQNRYTVEGIKPLSDARSSIEKELRDYQQRGMRTLAFAVGTEKNHLISGKIEEIATNLIWLGYVAIADPIREEVPEAIQSCKKAGIQVKMVTGDVSETAKEIGRRTGLLSENEIPESSITGTEFGLMDDNEAAIAVQKLKVLSRARPMDKLRLVKLLQQQNHVVAVTGDGTNDAPALNHADVGLAMGKTGTAVAKEASDIVLLDDSFNSIVNAVMWGRSLYQNIQRFVLFQITINIAALCVALVGPFIGVKLPLTVIQMLWINLIMDSFAALALATEPPSRKVLDRPPRHPDDFIVSPPMLKQILMTAGVFFGVMIWFLLYFLKDSIVTARELSLFFTLFVLLQFWNLFNAKVLGQQRSVFVRFFENKAFVFIAGVIMGGQILIVQFGGPFFRTVPLALNDWLILLLGSSVVLWIGEIWRFFQRLRS
ncbi:calcium-translocating P-type ATPase, PMCA-type [bacterium]|nr:calcium-translocating P-type ATPase, PMCA-type [bacterium]